MAIRTLLVPIITMIWTVIIVIDTYIQILSSFDRNCGDVRYFSSIPFDEWLFFSSTKLYDSLPPQLVISIHVTCIQCGIYVWEFRAGKREEKTYDEIIKWKTKKFKLTTRWFMMEMRRLKVEKSSSIHSQLVTDDNMPHHGCILYFTIFIFKYSLCVFSFCSVSFPTSQISNQDYLNKNFPTEYFGFVFLEWIANNNNNQPIAHSNTLSNLSASFSPVHGPWHRINFQFIFLQFFALSIFLLSFFRKHFAVFIVEQTVCLELAWFVVVRFIL